MKTQRLHPSSPKGIEPLDPDTDEQIWDAGYEMASYADTRRIGRPVGKHGLEIDVTELFILALKRDKRFPRGLNESHPQFWEYFKVFAEGVKDYADSSMGSSGHITIA